MNLPLNWLKEFVKINASATEIAEKLTLSGSETEKIVQHGKSLKNIVVGSIKEIKPHPDADKLRLAYVDVGKKDMLTIVCGAPNITAGQKVPVVLLGGEVPGMKIEARKIRGVASQGMLASERELGIGDDHGGIFILPDESTVGSDVIKLLELDDQVLELDITPNRPDCFSILGLAREVAALYGLKIQDTRNKKQIRCKKQETNKTASSVLRVTIQDKKLCPRYTGRVVENVKVGPSPLWIQNRLRQAGIRPINNAVDVTNYVMIELGQPMHAFDAALLYTKGRQDEHERKQIIVRSAKKGEKIDALDEKTYQLEPGMCVIADEKGPIAIGGIMGGTGSGVTEKTTTVILEAATFDPVSVRKTGRALGIKSDAGARHEKGIDRSAIEQASERAAGLLAEISKGAVLKARLLLARPIKNRPQSRCPSQR